VVFEDPDTAKKEREAKLRGEELDGTPIDGLTFGGRRKKRRRARTLESKKGNVSRKTISQIAKPKIHLSHRCEAYCLPRAIADMAYTYLSLLPDE
jgi:hypothetical protein